MRRFDESLPMALLRARELAMGYFRPMLNAHGLTEQQWRVIRVLEEYGDLEFHQLSRVALIQPPSLTGILTRLERADLVRRTRSRSDQRRLHLSLTPEGRRRFETISGEAEQRYGQIERRLGRANLKSLMRILREFDRLEGTLPFSSDPRAPATAGQARKRGASPRWKKKGSVPSG